MQNLANPTNNGAGRTMAVFELGMLAERTLAAQRTRLLALADRIAEITLIEDATQRDYAYATLAAATLPASTR